MSQRGKTSGEWGREREEEERRKKRSRAGKEVERKLRGGSGWGVMMSGYHGARMGDRKGRSK